MHWRPGEKMHEKIKQEARKHGLNVQQFEERLHQRVLARPDLQRELVRLPINTSNHETKA
jgi:hypothetical protein